MWWRSIAGLLLATSLTACGVTVAGVSTMPVPQTPDQALFESETDFDLALKAADAAPVCSATVTAACLTASTVTQMYEFAIQGTSYLNAAKAAVATYDALTTPTSSDQAKAVAALASLASVTSEITALIPQKGAK